MLSKSLFILLILSIFYSCNNKILKEETSILQEKKADSLKKYVLQISVKLTPKSRVFIQDWKEYQRLSSFLEDNKIYTPEESLLNAEELAKLTQELKDSIRIEELQTPSVKIRLNVIHNEALRIEDMSKISIITRDEINTEYGKIYEAFSALNSKINNNLNQKELNEELEDFINEITTIDSLNLDTILDKKPIKFQNKKLNDSKILKKLKIK